MAFVATYTNGQTVEVLHPFWPQGLWAVGPVWVTGIVTQLAFIPTTGVLETYIVSLPDGSLRAFDITQIRKTTKAPPPVRVVPVGFVRTYANATKVKVYYPAPWPWTWVFSPWTPGVVVNLVSAPTLTVPETYQVRLANGKVIAFDVALLRRL